LFNCTTSVKAAHAAWPGTVAVPQKRCPIEPVLYDPPAHSGNRTDKLHRRQKRPRRMRQNRLLAQSGSGWTRLPDQRLSPSCQLPSSSLRRALDLWATID